MTADPSCVSAAFFRTKAPNSDEVFVRDFTRCKKFGHGRSPDVAWAL